MKINPPIRIALTITIALAPLCRCLSADGADAAESPKPEMPWEKGSVSVGGFVAAIDSTVSFGVNSVGIDVNAEKLLGLDTELTVLRIDALYRPGKTRRNQLDFTYAAYHRTGHGVLSQSIDIGNASFPIGATMDTVFNFDIIRGTYSYAILQDDRMRIGVGLGIYAVPLKVSIEGQTSSSRIIAETTDTTLPLPSLALRADFLLVPKLYLRTSIDAMYVEISGFKGSLLDVVAGLEYRPWKHFGFGAGYNAFAAALEENNSKSDYPGANFVGNVGVRFSGLMFYGKAMF